MDIDYRNCLVIALLFINLSIALVHTQNEVELKKLKRELINETDKNKSLRDQNQMLIEFVEARNKIFKGEEVLDWLPFDVIDFNSELSPFDAFNVNIYSNVDSFSNILISFSLFFLIMLVYWCFSNISKKKISINF